MPQLALGLILANLVESYVDRPSCHEQFGDCQAVVR